MFLHKELIKIKEKIIDVWGHSFKSLKEVSIFFHVSINSLNNRVNNLNITVEEAIELLLKQTKNEWHKKQKLEQMKASFLAKGFLDFKTQEIVATKPYYSSGFNFFIKDVSNIKKSSNNLT
ncbi:hypothetical protein L3V79_00165 [Thiotrichales bacterium 19S9-12]|nr:hypothetical protein [Thiotrichales bacterium 19S9-11]MCF6810780.1 hypothetical protein [Thiotrichales bacterium 19S9-12]